MRITPKLLPSLAAMILCGPILPNASAINGVWINPASGNSWDDALNWELNTVADGGGSTADFSTIDLTGDNTVQLNSPRVIGNLVFGDTDILTPASWTLSNNGNAANTLTLDAVTPSITVNALGAGASVTINATIAGTAGLTKAGVGTLTLSAANTYTGGTTINAGTLAISNAGALSSGPVTFGGGTLTINYLGTANPVIANALSVPSGQSGVLDLIGSGVAANSLTVGTGNITVDGILRFTRSGGNTGATTFTAPLSGAGVIEIGNTNAGIAPGLGAGAQGRASFNHASAFTSFTGDFRVLNGGNLLMSGTAGGTINGHDVQIDSGGFMTLIGGATAGATVSTTFGILTGGGTIAKNSSVGIANMIVPSGNFSGSINQTALGITNGTIFLTKSGSASDSLILSGANNYAGNTTIQAGTLEIAGAGQLGNGTYAGAIANGGTLKYNSTANQTLSGIISGTGAVTKENSGTLILSGANTYTGNTTISAGTLQVGAGGTTGALATGSAILIANGSTLAFNRSSAHTAANVISGSGNITVTGAGALTLSGSNPDFTGNVAVNSVGSATAKLIIGNSNAITTGTITLSAGGVATAATGLELNNGVTLGSDVTVAMNSSTTGDFRSAVTVPAASIATLNASLVLNGDGIIQMNPSGSLTIGGNLSAGIGGYSGVFLFRGGGTTTLNGNFNLPAASVVKTDIGALTINSTGNVAKTFDISVGTVNLGADNALPTAAPLTIGQNSASASTFDLKGFSQSIGELSTFATGTGTRTITNSGAGTSILTVNQNTNSTFGSTGRITGAVALTKTGTGTLTLAGVNNSYTGATIVDEGTLVVSGALTGSNVTVEDGGVLGGFGSITGAVVANSGSVIAPGSSAGQLDTGTFTLNAGAALNFEIGGTIAGTEHDQLNVAGGITLGGSLNLAVINGFVPQAGQQFWLALNDDVELINDTFSNVPITDVLNSSGTVSLGGYSWTIYYSADATGLTSTGGNDLLLTAVPEPGSFLMLIGGAAILAGRRRRANTLAVR